MSAPCSSTPLRDWDNAGTRLELGDKVNAFIGAFAGIFAALQFLTLFQNLEVSPPLKAVVLLGLMVGFGSLVIYAPPLDVRGFALESNAWPGPPERHPNYGYQRHHRRPDLRRR